MTHDTLAQANAIAAAENRPYVRFEDMHTESLASKIGDKVVAVLSFPWLWVVVGIAAVCSLTTG